MEMYQILLWIVFPYMVLAIVGMGIIWQLDISKGVRSQSLPERILTGSLKGLLILCTLTGLAMIHLSNEFVQMVLWLLSLIQLNPDMNLILSISTLSQAHLIIFFLFLLALAFTNKIAYIIRPHLYLKKLLMKFH